MRELMLRPKSFDGRRKDGSEAEKYDCPKYIGKQLKASERSLQS